MNLADRVAYRIATDVAIKNRMRRDYSGSDQFFQTVEAIHEALQVMGEINGEEFLYGVGGVGKEAPETIFATQPLTRVEDEFEMYSTDYFGMSCYLVMGRGSSYLVTRPASD